MDNTSTKLYNMADVRVIFIHCVRQLIASLDDDQSVIVRNSIANIVGKWSSHMVLTPDSLPKIAGEVFGNDVLRKFYLGLKFVFFTNMSSGYGKAFVETLIFDLSVSVGLDMAMGEEEPLPTAINVYDAMPPEISATLVDSETAMKVMVANPWIICIMLMLAFMDLESDILLSTVKPKAP